RQLGNGLRGPARQILRPHQPMRRRDRATQPHSPQRKSLSLPDRCHGEAASRAGERRKTNGQRVTRAAQQSDSRRVQDNGAAAAPPGRKTAERVDKPFSLTPASARRLELFQDVSTFRLRFATARPALGMTKSRRQAERLPYKSEYCQSGSDYAGAPPRAPGRGGASGPTTTWRGGFSGGSFSPDAGVTLGGGLINSPCWISSLIWEPSSVSYSSNALAIASRWSRLAMRVCLAVWYASSSKRRTSRSISSAVASL